MKGGIVGVMIRVWVGVGVHRLESGCKVGLGVPGRGGLGVRIG